VANQFKMARTLSSVWVREAMIPPFTARCFNVCFTHDRADQVWTRTIRSKIRQFDYFERSLRGDISAFPQRRGRFTRWMSPNFTAFASGDIVRDFRVDPACSERAVPVWWLLKDVNGCFGDVSRDAAKQALQLRTNAAPAKSGNPMSAESGYC
jgi:hypothetical protein